MLRYLLWTQPCFHSILSGQYFTAVVYGDPHFVTFDNRSYTFNGFGEYVLLTTKESTSKTAFRVEGRFERVLDSEGNNRPPTESCKTYKTYTNYKKPVFQNGNLYLKKNIY